MFSPPSAATMWVQLCVNVCGYNFGTQNSHFVGKKKTFKNDKKLACAVQNMPFHNMLNALLLYCYSSLKNHSSDFTDSVPTKYLKGGSLFYHETTAEVKKKNTTVLPKANQPHRWRPQGNWFIIETKPSNYNITWCTLAPKDIFLPPWWYYKRASFVESRNPSKITTAWRDLYVKGILKMLCII